MAHPTFRRNALVVNDRSQAHPGPVASVLRPPPLSPSGERPGLGCLRQPRAGALHQGPKLHARYFAELHRGYKTTLAAGVRHFALTARSVSGIQIPQHTACWPDPSRNDSHFGGIISWPADQIIGGHMHAHQQRLHYLLVCDHMCDCSLET